MRTALTRLMLVAAVVLAGVVAAQQAYIQSRPEPRDVLLYPDQRVLSRVEGAIRPAVRLGDDLVVQGTKCNRSEDHVSVRGTTSWAAVDPPGSVVETGRGQAIRAPGCTTVEFRNAIPPAVAARTRALTATAGVACVSWRVTGTETPTDPLIRAVVWRTEPFDICP